MKYHVLFNQDCTDLFDSAERLTPEDVQRMVDEVAAGGADVLLVNPNAQLANYPSRIWQTFWDGYTEGDRSFFGTVPDDSLDRRERWIGRMSQLAVQCDYLATALERCHERGIAAGVSLRMNDMHDAPWPDSHLFSRFYRDHPQFHLEPYGGRSWGTRGLDYEHPAVREHYLALVRELAQDYDLDVLELDFMRFPYYFDRNNIDRHCRTMTGFIREVRAILNGAGRPISLIPRVASSPGAARQLGFDVQAWAREGLVDGITAASFLGTAWDMPIDQFRALVGPDTAIYASSEVSADRRDGLPVRYLPESHEMLRGFAAGYLATGADGINTFNYFLARNHRSVSADEFYGGMRGMRSLEDARRGPRIHALSAGYWTVECDMPEQVPAVVRRDRERRFDMLLAADRGDARTTALVYFDGENEPDDIWLRIGLHSLGHAAEIRKGPQGPDDDDASRKGRTAVFDVPAGVIADGRTELVIRSEKVDATILGIDICVQ